MRTGEWLYFAGYLLTFIACIPFSLKKPVTDVFALVLIIHAICGVVFCSRWRAAAWAGEAKDILNMYPRHSPSAIFTDSMVMANVALVLAAFYAIPLRASRSFWMVIASTSVYLVFTLPLPQGQYEDSTFRRCGLGGRLGLVAYALFVSQVTNETSQRRLYWRKHKLGDEVVQERVKRYRAEHLSEVERKHNRGSDSSEAETASDDETVDRLSSVIFNLKEELAHKQLFAMRKLGEEEQWHVDEKLIECSFQSKLGEGGFGSFFQGKYLHTDVALKVQKVAAQQEHMISLSHELRVFRHLRHPNIVSLYGACILPDEGEILLVQELVKGTTLHEAISHSDIIADDDACLSVLTGIFSAILYLHMQTPPVVHGDLKPQNVMLTSESRKPQLIDFGLSWKSYHSSKIHGGSWMWSSPEALSKAGRHCPMDIFSFGRLAFFVTTRREPFADIEQEQLRALVESQSTAKLDWPETMTSIQSEVSRLAKKCMEADPESRPTADAAYQQLQAISFAEQASVSHELRACLRNFRSKASASL